MFELYLDDLLIQTFNTTHEPNRLLEAGGKYPVKIGFLAQNGRATIKDVTIHMMTL